MIVFVLVGILNIMFNILNNNGKGNLEYKILSKYLKLMF